MSNYGIKIAKSGHTITEADQYMILTSKFPFMKAKNQGSLSVNVTGAGTFSATVTHSLGYYPAFIHYSIVDPVDTSDRYMARWEAGGGYLIGVDSYITASTLTIGWEDTSPSPGSFASYPYTVYFYYYLFYDNLA